MVSVCALSSPPLSTKLTLNRSPARSPRGLHITGNRLFGPQPQTAVYLCLWEITLGAVSAQMTPSMVSRLQRVGMAIGLNYSDLGNAPPSDAELQDDPDSRSIARSPLQLLLV